MQDADNTTRRPANGAHSTASVASPKSAPGQVPSLQVERKTFAFAFGENDHGRFLRITEEVGGRFDSIVIPLTGLNQFRATLDVVIQANESPPMSPVTVPRHETLAVLVIDDNPVDQELAARQIKQARPFKRELDFTFAADGQEALNKLQKQRFGLIILDWNLPLLGKGEVLRSLRRLGLRVPVVVLSGVDHEEITTVLDELAAAYLSKDDMSPAGFHRAIVQSLAQLGCVGPSGQPPDPAAVA